MSIRKLTAFVFAVALIVPSAATVPVYGGMASPPGVSAAGQILIQFEPGTSASREADIHRAVGAGTAESLGEGLYLAHPASGAAAEALVMRYSEYPEVRYAEPDAVVNVSDLPNDTLYETDQSGVFNAMKIIDAWDISRGDGGLLVAVIDTGIDFSHPDLKGRISSDGYDFVHKDSDPSDDNGHGTMCAGIIGALTGNEEGIAGAADCTILPIKSLSSSGSGYASSVAKGIRYAVDHGAKVISLSFGVTNGSKALEDAVGYAHENGVVVVAASGNSGAAMTYPAAYGSVIAVGAVTDALVRASYSCYGESLDLVAVGNGIRSTYYNGGSTYSTGTGTSFASPYAAALAALILSVNPSLSPEEVSSLMEQTASDLGPAGRDDEYGYGLLDFAAALAGARSSAGASSQPAAA